MAYDLGDVVGLSITTRNAAGTPEDAGAVALTIGLPDDTSVTPTASHTTLTGVYSVDYLTEQVGRHTIRWVATGANTSAYADVFDVWPANPEFVVPLSRALSKLGLTNPSSDNIEDVREYIAAATAVIERHRREVVIRRTVTDYTTVRWGQSLILKQTPVISLTSVATLNGSTSYPAGGLHVDPNTGIVRSIGGSYPSGDLAVTYVAGRTVVPANYRRAALIIVEHLWQTERPFASDTDGAFDDSMTMVRGMGFAVPNRAIELLGKPGPMVA